MIRKISLHHFRNYLDEEFEFGSKVNILLGQNGQGKTNLLEAIVLLCSGESFRYADNHIFLQNSKSEAVIRGDFQQKNDLNFELKLQILKTRKHHFLNDKKISASGLASRFHFVIFSPESLSAIKEGAEQRRNLVDELLVSVDPRNEVLVREFRKALKTRNRILKDAFENPALRGAQVELLQSINPSFFRLATALTEARIMALREMLPSIDETMQKISRSNKKTEINYVISSQAGLHLSHQDIHNLLEKRALELREAELSAGTSLVGPQKHDIVFLYNQNDSRFYSSQGQQRALILSFKMAQIVYHSKTHDASPILMLDDVLSELDEEKRESLIQFLQEIKTQIFLTTTDLKLTGDLARHDCRVIEIVERQSR